MNGPTTYAADDFVHPAFFYRGTEEYLTGVLSFVKAGLAAGEPVVVAVPAPKLRLIAAELGVDVERVRLLDMARAGRNPGRIIPGVVLAFADAHPTRKVRVVGEPVWAARTAMEYPACVQHEALINLALDDRAISVLCPYDAEALHPQALADAEATHPLVVDADGMRNSRAYDPDRILIECNRELPAAPTSAPSVEFDASTLGRARRFAGERANCLGLGGEHTELDLVVGELTANSVAHGGGGGTLGVWAEGDQLVCEVRDGGYITDPLAGRRPVAAHRTEGRGLLLVNHLADLVRTHTTPKGTTTRLHLTMPAHDSRPAGPGAKQHLDQPNHRGGVSPGQAPLRWQTHDALRAASRFTRYLQNQQADAEPAQKLTVEGRHQLRSALDALAASEALSENIEQWRNRLVRLARRQGARWNEIGTALGVSKQAAHERYGDARRRTAGRQPIAGNGAGRAPGVPRRNTPGV